MINGENNIYYTSLNGLNTISDVQDQITYITNELSSLSGSILNTSNNSYFNNLYTNHVYNILDNNVYLSFNNGISLNYYNYDLVLQTDGNLVLYKSGVAFWNTQGAVNQANDNTNNIILNTNQLNNLYSEITTISGFVYSFYNTQYTNNNLLYSTISSNYYYNNNTINLFYTTLSNKIYSFSSNQNLINNSLSGYINNFYSNQTVINNNLTSLINTTISGVNYSFNNVYNTISGNYNNYLNYQSVINNSLSNLNVSLSGKFYSINNNYNILNNQFTNFKYKDFFIGDITYSNTYTSVYLTRDTSNNYLFNFELEIGPQGLIGPQGDPAQNPFGTGVDVAAFISSILSLVGSIAFGIAQEMILTALGFSTLTAVEGTILELEASVLSLERDVIYLQLKSEAQDEKITKLQYDIIDLFNLIRQQEVKTQKISCDGVSTVINGPLQVYNIGSLDFTFDTITPNNRIVGNTEYLGRSINLN